MAVLLRNIDVQYISLVKKGANKRTIIYKSADDSPHSWEIPIRKFDEEKGIVYGIVYAPDDVDTQGEYTTAEEIEKAAYRFMRNLNLHNVDKQHSFSPEGAYVAESWIVRKGDPLFPNEKEGAWAVGIKLEDEELRDQVKKGELKALSMAGKADKLFEKTWDVTENEIRDRLRDPDDFRPDTFRRKKISDEKGGIWLIVGKLKNGNDSMVAQAIRFPRKTENNPDGWTLEEAKKWKQDHKDQFKKDITWKTEKAMTFESEYAMRDIWGLTSALETSMRSIMEDKDIKDKKAAISDCLDQFKNTVLDKLALKSDEGIIRKFIDFIKNQLKQEDDDMTKEEVTAIVKEQLEEFKKGLKEPLSKEDMATVVKEVVKPLSERIEKLEKQAPGTKQDDDPVKKDKDLEKLGAEIAKMVNEEN